LRRVVWQKYTDVSEVLTASIIASSPAWVKRIDGTMAKIEEIHGM
jgi:hypothetical protein